MVYWFCKLDKKLDGDCVISHLAFMSDFYSVSKPKKQ